MPILFDQNIVSEQELEELLIWYNDSLKKRGEEQHPQCFYDWINSANAGDQKSQSFLKFFNNTLVDLLNFYENGFPYEIVLKIRSTITTKQESFLDYLGELLLITHLLKGFHKDCVLLGIDFKIGNNKDVDIAFKSGSHIQLIEIKNLHHLSKKIVGDTIQRKTIGKVSNKTKDYQLIKKYFDDHYPNCGVTLSIALFIWEDYAEIASQEFDTEKIRKALGNDFLPPTTIICENIQGLYVWRICPLDEAMKRYRDQKNINEIS